MTEKMVEISQKSLTRIHERNMELDAENQTKEKEVQFLMGVIERLTLRGLRHKNPVV